MRWKPSGKLPDRMSYRAVRKGRRDFNHFFRELDGLRGEKLSARRDRIWDPEADGG